MTNRGHLVRKQITDRRGRRTTVLVNPNQDMPEPKRVSAASHLLAVLFDTIASKLNSRGHKLSRQRLGAAFSDWSPGGSTPADAAHGLLTHLMRRYGRTPKASGRSKLDRDKKVVAEPSDKPKRVSSKSKALPRHVVADIIAALVPLANLTGDDASKYNALVAKLRGDDVKLIKRHPAAAGGDLSSKDLETVQTVDVKVDPELLTSVSGGSPYRIQGYEIRLMGRHSRVQMPDGQSVAIPGAPPDNLLDAFRFVKWRLKPDSVGTRKVADAPKPPDKPSPEPGEPAKNWQRKATIEDAFDDWEGPQGHMQQFPTMTMGKVTVEYKRHLPPKPGNAHGEPGYIIKMDGRVLNRPDISRGGQRGRGPHALESMHQAIETIWMANRGMYDLAKPEPKPEPPIPEPIPEPTPEPTKAPRIDPEDKASDEYKDKQMMGLGKQAEASPHGKSLADAVAELDLKEGVTATSSKVMVRRSPKHGPEFHINIHVDWGKGSKKDAPKIGKDTAKQIIDKLGGRAFKGEYRETYYGAPSALSVSGWTYTLRYFPEAKPMGETSPKPEPKAPIIDKPQEPAHGDVARDIPVKGEKVRVQGVPGVFTFDHVSGDKVILTNARGMPARVSLSRVQRKGHKASDHKPRLEHVEDPAHKETAEVAHSDIMTAVGKAAAWVPGQTSMRDLTEELYGRLHRLGVSRSDISAMQTSVEEAASRWYTSDEYQETLATARDNRRLDDVRDKTPFAAAYMRQLSNGHDPEMAWSRAKAVITEKAATPYARVQTTEAPKMSVQSAEVVRSTLPEKRRLSARVAEDRALMRDAVLSALRAQDKPAVTSDVNVAAGNALFKDGYSTSGSMIASELKRLEKEGLVERSKRGNRAGKGTTVWSLKPEPPPDKPRASKKAKAWSDIVAEGKELAKTDKAAAKAKLEEAQVAYTKEAGHPSKSIGFEIAALDGPERKRKVEKRTQEPAKRQPKSMKRLRKVAERARSDAEASLGQDRQTNTRRRVSMAASAEREASQKKALADTSLKIADAVEAGDTRLGGVSTFLHVQELSRIMREAVFAAESHKMKTTPGHPDNYKRSPTVDDIKHVEFPHPTPHMENLKDVVAAVKKLSASQKRGLGNAVPTLEREMRAVVGTGKYVVPLTTPESQEALTRLVSIARKRKVQEYGLTNVHDELKRFNRVKSMGFTDAKSLKDGLEAYMELHTGAPKVDPLKEKMRSLVGNKIPGYFPTPPKVVDKVMQRADIGKNMRVLEPSAGSGAIADAAKAKGAEVDTVERNNTLREILEMKGHKLVSNDTMEHKGEYDRIVMNPPFEGGAEMEHVMHAFHNQLAPGGRLVSVMSAGPFFRDDRKSQIFRKWVEREGGRVEDLPAGSFKDSDKSTGVATKIIVIDKLQRGPTGKQSEAKDRAESKARRLSAKAEASFQASHDETKHIPMGQPVLRGHHSAPKHLRALERSDKKMRQAVDQGKAAKKAEWAASGSGKAVMSDDPEAVAALTTKLRQAEAQRDAYKKANKAWKKGRHEQMRKEGFSEKMIEAAERHANMFSWRADKPFDTTNVGANIRRIKGRIDELRAEAGREAMEPIEGKGFRVEEDTEDKRVRIHMDGKPDKETRTKLKRAGFKWSPSAEAWQRLSNEAGRRAARQMAEELPSK